MPAADDLRLGQLLGGLSLTCDLANGFPPEKVLRTVVLAVALGRRHGLDGEQLRTTYYTVLLRYLGCTGFAHEEGQHYGAGDDISVRQAMALADVTDPVGTMAHIVRRVGAGGSLPARAAAIARLVGDGKAMRQHAGAQCEASIHLAEILGLAATCGQSLAQTCERYDGRGAPHGLPGEALTLPIRLLHLADAAEIAHHRDGRDAALDLVRRRQGRHLDPTLARLFLADAPPLFAALESPGVWESYLESEPRPFLVATASRLDDVARAFAHFVDLKSTFTLGHSTGVAALADRAAAAAGLAEADRALIRRAAWLHDLGRASVSNRIWDKPGPLTASERERVRLHAYYTERVLWQAPALRPIAQLASAAHERLDGTGYHRALPGSLQGRAARLLAAADVCQALAEPRPHRPALAGDALRRVLLDEVAATRLDPLAVSAVLEAAGQPAAPRAWPAGLSDREVEVLRLLARGRSNKEIAAALAISPRTVQHHVMHIYGKLDVGSRAAAALFATEQGLLAG